MSPTHLFGMSFVLFDHLFGLFCLMLVVRRLGLLELLFRLLFHLFHLPLGLPHGPRRTVGGARSEEQEETQQRDSDGGFSFHFRGFGHKNKNFLPTAYD